MASKVLEPHADKGGVMHWCLSQGGPAARFEFADLTPKQRILNLI